MSKVDAPSGAVTIAQNLGTSELLGTLTREAMAG